MEFVPELESNQEQADTRMLLHARQTVISGPVVTRLDETYILILLLSHRHHRHQCKVDHIANSLL